MSRSVRGPDYGLQVYEKHPDADAYRVGAGFTGYAILAVEKRFSDGELAAEYWQAFSGVWDGHGKKARIRRQVIERFATLPHFDE